MAKTLILGVVAVVLVGAGWSAGRAQTTQADFEIAVGTTDGRVRIDCVRGCRISSDSVIQSAGPLGISDPRFATVVMPSSKCIADSAQFEVGPCRLLGWAQP